MTINIAEIPFDRIPIKLLWNGWISDTNILKQQGWECFANQEHSLNMEGYNLTVMLRCPNGKVLINGCTFLSRYSLNFRSKRIAENLRYILCEGGIKMSHYTIHDKYQIYPDRIEKGSRFSEFELFNKVQPFDGFAYMPRTEGLLDTQVFKYKEESKAIYLPPSEQANYHLNELLKWQHEEMKEVNQILTLEESMKQNPVLTAKIYQLSAVA